MKFGMNPAPYYRSKRSTTQIMLELLLGLAVVWVCAIVYNFSVDSGDGIRAIVNPIVAVLSVMLTEALFLLPKNRANKESLKQLCVNVLNSYGYITGLILALLLPVGTSYYAIVVSSIFAIAVGKMLFGGFGHNIFNPAILGRIFAQTAFLSQFSYTTSETVTTGATVTSALSGDAWCLDKVSTSLGDLLLGKYAGALGETFTIAIVLVGVVLAIRRVIDWRAPAFYVGSIFVATLVMGLCSGYGVDSFEYALVQLSIGGIVFGAVFCITDPVTTPTSPSGRITYGLGAAALTLLIRYLGNTPEGVAYSILLMNAFTPLIDSSVKGLSNQYTRKKIITTAVMAAVTLVSGVASSSAIDRVLVYNDQFATTEYGYSVVEINKVSESGKISTYHAVVTSNYDHDHDTYTENGAGDKTYTNESFSSFATVEYNVSLNYDAKTIVGFEQLSTGAGGGFGDKMLDYNNDEIEWGEGIAYFSTASGKAAKAAMKEFYDTFVNASEENPISFDVYTAVAYTAQWLNSQQFGKENTVVSTCATYTANAFIYMVNAVIGYATADHTSGKVGK